MRGTLIIMPTLSSVHIRFVCRRWSKGQNFYTYKAWRWRQCNDPCCENNIICSLVTLLSHPWQDNVHWLGLYTLWQVSSGHFRIFWYGAMFYLVTVCGNHVWGIATALTDNLHLDFKYRVKWQSERFQLRRLRKSNEWSQKLEILQDVTKTRFPVVRKMITTFWSFAISAYRFPTHRMSSLNTFSK